jgi:enoyl-CoA hydratase
MVSVIYDKPSKGIAKVTINRPEALNALNTTVLFNLENVLSEIERDKDLRVVVITGAGRSFVAGADIKEMQSLNSIEAREFAEFGLRVMRRIESLTIPVIAAVNGFALGGGCELALACEIRYASEKAKFGQPEVSLGITPGFGGTQRLSRLVGLAQAKELIYTGDIIDAYKAKNIGLVNEVFSPETLDEEVMKLATKIANQSKNAVCYAKAAINKGLETDLATSMEIERNLFALCFSSEDQKEGMQAFIEKRKPTF